MLSHRMLLPSQHGFLPGRSVETAGIEQLNFITSALDRGLCVDTIYLDFSKAFDTIPHDLLLVTLHSYGLDGCLFSWISNYLCDRYQSVLFNGAYSSPKVISSGVIQGSVLGPLLFLIYVNEIDTCISSSFIVKYADDIKLSCAFSNESHVAVSEQLQNDLSKLCRWSSTHGLSLNPNKCKVMHFGRSNTCIPYIVDDSVLEKVSSFKDLGVRVSNVCNFNEHVFSVYAKANRTLGLIQKVFVSRNRSLLVTIYKTHVRSLLEFGSILWCPYRQFLSDRIERIQRRFTRFFPDLRYLPYRERLCKLNLLSLFARRLRYKLIFMYKVVNGLTILNSADFFVPSSSSFVLRGNSMKFIPPSSSKDCRRYFFTVDAVFHWNRLSTDEVQVGNVTTFKNSITSYFCRNDIW
jgi:hypothetical protein